MTPTSAGAPPAASCANSALPITPQSIATPMPPASSPSARQTFIPPSNTLSRRRNPSNLRRAPSSRLSASAPKCTDYGPSLPERTSSSTKMPMKPLRLPLRLRNLLLQILIANNLGFRILKFPLALMARNAVLDFAKRPCSKKNSCGDRRSVELRALCNDSPRTPPGPEGSNGNGSASCAAEYPKFLSS